MIRKKAYQEFGIKEDTAKIDSLSGGLQMHNPQNYYRPMKEKIEEFITKIRQTIINFNNDDGPKLRVKDLCLNTIEEAYKLKQDIINNMTKLLDQFNFEYNISHAPQTIVASQGHQSLQVTGQSIFMKLERVFVDCFREMINLKLKQQFTSTNKKVQKRKIKNLKKKEQEKERERELEEERKKKEAEQADNKITVNTSNAVQMLINPEPVQLTKQDFTEVKENKKKKKKGKKKAAEPVEEIKIEEKSL